MNLNFNTTIYLNREEAKAAGFRALTIGYQLPGEQPMLDNVLADLRRGSINHCLVESESGVAVWRSFRSGTSGGCAQSFQMGAKGCAAGNGNAKAKRSRKRRRVVVRPARGDKRNCKSNRKGKRV